MVLTARREDRLKSLADEAKSLGAGDVTVIVLDLAIPGSAEALHRRVADKHIAIDYLINNAGFGTHGRFAKLPIDRELEEINLNISSLVALTRLFLPPMIEHKRGTIINVASTAAFQPIPFMATYAATKSFVLSFSEALAEEVRGTGVTVMALCPGLTRTEFQQVAGTEHTKVPSFVYMDPKIVVRQALDSARRGKRVRISGMINLVMAESIRLIPRSFAARIAGSRFQQNDS